MPKPSSFELPEPMYCGIELAMSIPQANWPVRVGAGVAPGPYPD
ncbi:MAG: hypothetical protein ACOCVH_02645 [Verrucomicrobiota bacterium]